MLKQGDIYDLAKGAGLSDSRARVAAAIAMAESSGDPSAHNRVPPDDSYGLWQINMLGRLGPERRRQFKLASNAELFSPVVNARAMAQISSGGGNFNPWSTYTNGAYREYLDGDLDRTDRASLLEILKAAPGAVRGALGGAADEAAGAVTGPIGAVVDVGQSAAQVAVAVAKAAAWISDSENWVRVAYVSVGSIVAVSGLIMLVQSSQAGRTATKAATAVVTKGVAK